MYKIGLENNADGRSQAWVLGHPGCFAYGENGAQAMHAVPQAIRDYLGWVSSHTSENWLEGSGDDFQLEETWDCYSINDVYELAQEGYEVNAWFRHDWIPLSASEIEHGQLLLAWGRQELLDTIKGISTEMLEVIYPGERWSISGILKHIGSAEWWYMDRLGLAFPRSDLPEDPLQRLEKVRWMLNIVLPGLVGSTQVVGTSGEFWSPRKLLRRAVWHEYDHIIHIRKLL